MVMEAKYFDEHPTKYLDDNGKSTMNEDAFPIANIWIFHDFPMSC